MKRIAPGSLTIACLVAAPAALADTAALDDFMQNVDGFSARFEQTLYDGTGEVLQDQAGSVTLERPARFRWEYDGADGQAAGQTLVSDGTRVWLYDPELEQVTVNRIDERVAGTPLVVLMGDEPLDTAFTLSDLGESEGISWVELAPKADGVDFEAVYVGFRDGELSAMELRDSFDQATQIRFSDYRVDGDIDPSRFTFEVPDGVDVIGLEE